MPNDNDKPSYTMAHKARNESRMVVEGVDEPAKETFASHVPAGYKSPDVEDRRDSLTHQVLGKIQHHFNPVKF